MAVERVTEVQRVDVVFHDDVLLQIRQVVLLQELHDGIAIGFGLGGPVDVGAQVRHRREHVEGLAAVGRHARIGHGRHVQVEREVGRQILLGESRAGALCSAR